MGARRLGPVRHAGCIFVCVPALHRQRRAGRELVDQADEGAAGRQAAAPAGEDERPQEDRFCCCYEPHTHSSGPGELEATGRPLINISDGHITEIATSLYVPPRRLQRACMLYKYSSQ